MKEKMKKGKVKTFALTAAYNLCQLTQHMAARSFHLQKKIKSNTDKNNTCDAERQQKKQVQYICWIGQMKETG